MRALKRVLVILALICSSVVMSAAPSGAHEWKYYAYESCVYLRGHSTNPYGYPIAVTEYYSSGCDSYKNVRLYSVSGRQQTSDFDDSFSRYSPAIAVGPFVWWPDFSSHKICKADGDCINRYIN